MQNSEEVIICKPNEAQIAEAKTWPIWSKEVSRFDWTYSSKETCYVLEGRVEVTNKAGKVFKFGKGDWVQFPSGMSCVWDVKEAIRKHYNFD